MTRIAQFRRRHVIDALTRRIDAVVITDTAGGQQVVVYRRT